MFLPRRYLPSMSALLAFEATARLGSATQAAAELSLTQSAVSRQLKALEDQLGVALLTRAGRGLVLTPRGQDYVREVRGMLQRLAQATVSVQTEAEGGPLNLAILPAFGMHWLAPRLRDFARRHPEVTVNLSTRFAPFDFRGTSFDAAIHFGREDWPGVRYLPLLPETVVPVCAPALIPRPLDDPGQILDYDLLHLDTRPRGWARWLHAVGHHVEPPPGMVFDQFSTMAQAAIHGLGIALLPTFFAEPYLTSGQLVLASEQTSQSIGSYYLVWPAERAEPSALSSFRDWLAGQSAPAERQNQA
ncbi:LysR substrate-binding domain-containing protein [Roseobacter sinensis]|uniref:LysR substrate-binding domain-containing protein n=1 Tax=Roseobacter sinensis TaxID=2931391 RepID=A0ABT3BBJ3_9RHOB|nr:LysR substrate-binding domain-containing protein [Roseobacter sp. WL0113]MCV3270524.1 LysR substrate-binding domain-containing protein [Roseobacter sp. WL0113]